MVQLYKTLGQVPFLRCPPTPQAILVHPGLSDVRLWRARLSPAQLTHLLTTMSATTHAITSMDLEEISLAGIEASLLAGALGGLERVGLGVGLGLTGLTRGQVRTRRLSP